MIKLVFISGVIMLSCGPVKTNQPVAKIDTIEVVVPAVEQVINSMTVHKGEVKKPGKNIRALPACIKNKINTFKKARKHEQPQKVIEYVYMDKKVYYIVMPCCDFFNEVYDATCKLMGSPDGGITGRGDGKLPDFFKKTSKEKLIWQASK